MAYPRLFFCCLFLCFFLGKVYSQTCTVFVSDTLICQGTTVDFSVNISGGTPTAFSWDFGNGFTANTSLASHVYNASGSFTPSVTVTFAGGATCVSSGKKIRVFDNPVSKFVITTADTMCFNGNLLCITDQSAPGLSNAPIKRRVFQLSNGYLQIDSGIYSSNICYQNNIDFGGHIYTLVLEITDTNNCVTRTSKEDSVLLYPKTEPLYFETNFALTCFLPKVTIDNFSATTTTGLRKFYWDFGDGSPFDTADWKTVTHQYTGKGPYKPKLFTESENGCKDSAIARDSIWGIVPDSSILISQKQTQCYEDNVFYFSTYNTVGKSIWKAINDNDELEWTNATVNDQADSLEYDNCGRLRINLTTYYPDCTVDADTFITILGPKATIQRRGVLGESIINSNQCEIFDTIRFLTPIPYLSCTYGNGSITHFWDFNDAFAPPCTTDTKNGINVGINCAYSLDSINVKHFYTPGKEQCYFPSLFLTDTSTGCKNKTETTLLLTAPDASPDSLAVPPRSGLTVSRKKICLSESVTFIFKDILPVCGYEKAFINVDSACGKNNWRLIDTLGLGEFGYPYNSICDSSGWITVGLIIKNGNDKNGNECYDTAWYHHLIEVERINPLFKYSINTCKPYVINVTPNEPVQLPVKKVKWTLYSFFNNYIDSSSQYFLNNDSIILNDTLHFYKSGNYRIESRFTGNICNRIMFYDFGIGFYMRIIAPKIACINDSVSLDAFIRYFDPSGRFDIQAGAYLNPNPNWNYENNTKERVYWDIGDGKGFFYPGANPKVKYNKTGLYTLKIAAVDSNGCWDTLVVKDTLRIIDMKAHIVGLQSQYFCAPQIVLFKDSSVVLDSLTAPLPSTMDTVKFWQWDFGDGTPLSSLQNPAHNFTSNGRFNIKLTAFLDNGCKDTISTFIDLKGPAATFDIIDTMGCEPFEAKFINTTGKQLKNWTWYFGDSLNQTFTTTDTNDVLFTYLKAGVYTISLSSSEDVFNTTTGNTINCNSFFPDPTTLKPSRKVYVLPTPPLNVFSLDSICPNQPIAFTAVGDSIYKKFNWQFGDGKLLASTRPDTIVTHIYDSAGIYKFLLIPIHSTGYRCVDTVAKNINVLSVNANFTIDETAIPLFKFTNTSTNAVRYEWDFGKPALGASNTSIQVNPEINFGSDTGMYTICLLAFNIDDCWDSVCKPVRVDQTKIIIPNVFTPDNNDGKNDAFDIDILGFTVYDLTIYNRWGAKVFEGDKDGFGNDGINWNGRLRNEGEECAAGTYYFIFTYKLNTQLEPETVKGTITLIRDKQ